MISVGRYEKVSKKYHEEKEKSKLLGISIKPTRFWYKFEEKETSDWLGTSYDYPYEWFLGGMDSCPGDPGSPLWRNVATGGEDGAMRATQIGILSRGRGCSGFNEPSVFVSVKEMYDWIKAMVAEHKSNDTGLCNERSKEANVEELHKSKQFVMRSWKKRNKKSDDKTDSYEDVFDDQFYQSNYTPKKEGNGFKPERKKVFKKMIISREKNLEVKPKSKDFNISHWNTRSKVKEDLRPREEEFIPRNWKYRSNKKDEKNTTQRSGVKFKRYSYKIIHHGDYDNYDNHQGNYQDDDHQIDINEDV